MAVGVLIAIAAWAKIAKPMPPLSDARARVLLAEEFPGKPLDGLWVSVDGRGALARSGAAALVLCEVGDGYVARSIPWAQALVASFRDGVLKLDLADVSAPNARLSFLSWPPAVFPEVVAGSGKKTAENKRSSGRRSPSGGGDH